MFRRLPFLQITKQIRLPATQSLNNTGVECHGKIKKRVCIRRFESKHYALIRFQEVCSINPSSQSDEIYNYFCVNSPMKLLQEYVQIKVCAVKLQWHCNLFSHVGIGDVSKRVYNNNNNNNNH